MRSLSVLLCLLSLAGGCAVVHAQAAAPDALARSTQMIVVTTSDWNAIEGRLQRYERADTQQAWHPVGAPIPDVVGHNGMGWGIGVTPTDDAGIRLPADPVKREGDGKSPAGIFSLGSAFGDAAQPLPGLKLPYLTLTPSIECVDDAASKFYNRIVDRSTLAPDWNSSEHMRDVGEAYRWGIVIDHNGTVVAPGRPAPRPGGGSCVFLHIWHRPDQGTAGCTAMSDSDLVTLTTWLDPARRPLLVQLPQPAYDRLADRWKLPKPVGSR